MDVRIDLQSGLQNLIKSPTEDFRSLQRQSEQRDHYVTSVRKAEDHVSRFALTYVYVAKIQYLNWLEQSSNDDATD